MDYAAFSVEKIHILRVDPGEDVLLAVRHFLERTGLSQAVVLGGYGTLAKYSLQPDSHQ
jgi:predicted DNA-binding protein with PD1-like motif